MLSRKNVTFRYIHYDVIAHLYYNPPSLSEQGQLFKPVSVEGRACVLGVVWGGLLMGARSQQGSAKIKTG